MSIEHGIIRASIDLEESRRKREASDRERLIAFARFDPDWHRHQLDSALVADDFAAAFHLHRLVQGQPWDAGLHVHCAHLFARLGRRQESATHLAQALLLNPRISLWPVDAKAARAAANRRLRPTTGPEPRETVWPLISLEHQDSIIDLLLAQVAADDAAGVRQTMAEIADRLPKENPEYAETL